jgi:hypothetical protein
MYDSDGVAASTLSADLASYQRVHLMTEEEAGPLIDRLNARNILTHADKRALLEVEMQHRYYTTGRHGLSYGKLYHDADGGYSMDHLKTVMKRIQGDIEDGTHPYINTEDDKLLDQSLREVLNIGKDKRSWNSEEDDDDGHYNEDDEEAVEEQRVEAEKVDNADKE